jgi:hypothetical protein
MAVKMRFSTCIFVPQVDEQGVAGRIKFNSNFGPETPIFDIVNLKNTGWHKVGNWSQDGGLKMSAPKEIRFQGNKLIVADYVSDLANRTLDVVTIIEAPFVMYTVSEKDVNISDIKPHEIEGKYFQLNSEMFLRSFTFSPPEGVFVRSFLLLRHMPPAVVRINHEPLPRY